MKNLKEISINPAELEEDCLLSEMEMLQTLGGEEEESSTYVICVFRPC